MTINEELLAARASLKYQAAVWLGRLADLVALPCVVLVIFDVLPSSMLTELVVFIVAAIGLSMLLLFTIGGRPTPELARMYTRDLLWLGPK